MCTKLERNTNIKSGNTCVQCLHEQGVVVRVNIYLDTLGRHIGGSAQLAIRESVNLINERGV